MQLPAPPGRESQKPFTQRKLQQSSASLQTSPTTRQAVPPRQRLPPLPSSAHTFEQQELSEAHASPAGRQAPPETHTLPSHLFPQHSSLDEQSWPDVLQISSTHLPPEQPSEQQSAAVWQS